MASATKADDPRVVSEDPSSLSAGSKARFNRFSKRDENTGEPYLGPDEFIDAIAPIDEDYVRSCNQCPRRCSSFPELQRARGRAIHRIPNISSRSTR